MGAPKKIFHSNIRFLRTRKRFSQEELAQLIGIKRITLQALESGRTKNPAAADLLKFSEQFSISLDALMKTDLSRLGELRLRELEAGNDVYISGGQLRILAITVDKANKENVEYVPVKAKAGYLSGHSDPEFIATLPKYTFPHLPRGGTYRMFPISGDSMLPIPDGSEIIGRYVQDWKTIKAKTACIVILNSGNDFVFKLVTIQKDRNVLLESLNRNYEPYTVSVGAIVEIWQFYSYQSTEIPEAMTVFQELKTMILDLKKEVISHH